MRIFIALPLSADTDLFHNLSQKNFHDYILDKSYDAGS
jgi:hypothetical protein